MSDTTPAPEADEPERPGTGPVEPTGSAEPATPVEPAAAPEPTAAPAPEPEAGHRVVYVEAPVPPRPRGNRVLGVLLALIGTVVFAALYAGVAGILFFFGGSGLFGTLLGRFVASAAFWVPVLVFVLAFILLVVILNRAGWAAHVFGSLLLAFVVYFASIGLLLLVGRILPGYGSVTFSRVALTPQIIASAVIAREVAIWFGLVISVRGRRVRARNAEARERYDRELAEQRAQYQNPAGPPER